MCSQPARDEKRGFGENKFFLILSIVIHVIISIDQDSEFPVREAKAEADR